MTGEGSTKGPQSPSHTHRASVARQRGKMCSRSISGVIVCESTWQQTPRTDAPRAPWSFHSVK